MDDLRDCPPQTGSRAIKSARSGANLALFYEHVAASKQFFKSEGSSHVFGDRRAAWLTYKRNPPQVLHPRQRHRCGRLNRPHPWPAAKAVCSPPTIAVVVWPFGVFLYFEQSAQYLNSHTRTYKPANSLKFQSSEIGRQEDDTMQGIPETRWCAFLHPGAARLYTWSSRSPLLKKPVVSTVLKSRVFSFGTLLVSFCAAVSHVTPSVYLPFPGLQRGRHRYNRWSWARRSSQMFIVRETSLG